MKVAGKDRAGDENEGESPESKTSFWWLILHENIYYQHHNGLVDEKVYDGWNVELEQFIHAKQLGLFWDKGMKRFFRTEFRQAVGGMIDDA